MVVKIAIIKSGNIGTSPVIDLLLDERADRPNIDVRTFGSGAKMNPEQVEDVVPKIDAFEPDFAIFISPNPGAPGPAKARELLSEKELTIENNFNMLDQMIEKNNLIEGIFEIKKWCYKHKEEYQDNNDFNELVRIVKEIDEEKDFSHCSYEDIRYLLRPFENIPLKLKRQFQLSTMDYYTMFIASRHFSPFSRLERQ